MIYTLGRDGPELPGSNTEANRALKDPLKTYELLFLTFPDFKSNFELQI